MEISVRLFAGLRELAASGSLQLRLAEGSTVNRAIAELRKGPLRGLPEGTAFVTAVDREYVDRGRVLEDGDELALVPPVSGGGADPVRHAELTAEPLDVEALRRTVADASSGATVVFVGTPRDVPSLEYEAYVEMARAQIAVLARQVAIEHGLVAVAVAHRTGTVALGEASIVVAVSAAHRAPAFEGARQLLDAVKAQAPIWKGERAPDGEERRHDGTLPGT